MDVVIVGGGVGGLAAALGFGRQGHRVTLLEHDEQHGPADPTDVYRSWDRPGVPQWRLYHAFMARTRQQLLAHAPDVLDTLHVAGVQEVDLAVILADERRSEDDELRALAVRRPVLEWALRQAVAACPDVDVRAGTPATGVVVERGRVRGAVTDHDVFSAELVVNAAGRRSPVPGWLTGAGIAVPPADRTACGIAYYSRYFHLRDGVTMPALRGAVVEAGVLGHIGYGIALGDAGSYGVLLAVPTHDATLRVLRHPAAWDVAAGLLERVAVFVDDEVGEPLNDPVPMHRLENGFVPWTVDDRPVAPGLVSIGDAWAVTDPTFGWGASLAIAHGFGVADCVAAHDGDIDASLEAFHASFAPEVAERVELARDQERARPRGWRDPPGDPAPAVVDRAAFRFASQRLIGRDPHSSRIVLRSLNLLSLPSSVAADERVCQLTAEYLATHRFDPGRTMAGPTRDEMVAALSSRER